MIQTHLSNLYKNSKKKKKKKKKKKNQYDQKFTSNH